MSLQKVWVDDSVSLDQARGWRILSMVSGQVHHGFHYQSLQQSNLWLEVFRKHSPAAGAVEVRTIYETLATSVAESYRGKSVHVVSLGCGEGRKDLVLLGALVEAGAKVLWTPQDISLSLVLHTAGSASDLPLQSIHPVVADLMGIADWRTVFDPIDPLTPRLITFYGLVPNFDPDFLLPCWSSLVRPEDRLLVSANLSPAMNESKAAYLEATQAIQTQYDNPETQRWLSAIVQDWGIAQHLENYRIRLESRHDLLRLVAAMDWRESLNLLWEDQEIPVRQGDNFRLFFSYRYTPGRFRELASRAGLGVMGEWIARSRDEGVWMLSKN